jgi:hypothetical protein
VLDGDVTTGRTVNVRGGSRDSAALWSEFHTIAPKTRQHDDTRIIPR